MAMKWNGPGTLIGTKSRKQYFRGDVVDPEDVSRERMEEFKDKKYLVGKMPEEVVEQNRKKAEAKKRGRPAKEASKGDGDPDPLGDDPDAGEGDNPKTSAGPKV